MTGKLILALPSKGRLMEQCTAALANAGLSVTRPAGAARGYKAEIEGLPGVEVNLVGVQIAQLALGVLGVLVITGEYSTGMIRATMAAVPKRLPVLWAKAIVYGVVVLALAAPATLIAFAVGQSILARQHIDIAFTHPGVARAVFGAALYLTTIGLFGLAIGAIEMPRPTDRDGRATKAL